jgi:pimeloyl-ACP methyl ester carboxylesterase
LIAAAMGNDPASVEGPPPLRALVERYDPAVSELGRRRVLIRLEIGDEAWDAMVGETAQLVPARDDERPEAVLSADARAWRSIAADVRGGMTAYRSGRLRIRRDLHLGIAFLAATSGATQDGRLELRRVTTPIGEISTAQAGTGQAVVAIHGLGATKASMLPTVAALAGRFRVIAIDLPGFGDSTKPLGAAYDPRFFARAVVGVLDGLGLERAHLVGNSLGGRVAIEVGLREPGRVGRLGLLAPSLAWRRSRPWAPLLKLVRPELGAIQPAPRKVVEAIVGQVVPGATEGWAAAGIDEFLRAYLTPRGRAAFYAAARQIYLEEPYGPDGFWTRLGGLTVPSLFVWGRQDTLVPHAFARHVAQTLPTARHLELDCGHVPQLERPGPVHGALARFFAG